MLLGQAIDRGLRTSQKQINWILLVGKFYLQKQKLFHEGKTSLIGYLAELKNKIMVERIRQQATKILGVGQTLQSAGGLA